MSESIKYNQLSPEIVAKCAPGITKLEQIIFANEAQIHGRTRGYDRLVSQARAIEAELKATAPASGEPGDGEGEQLLAFAGKIIDLHKNDGDIGDVGGDQIQEWAVKFGLLTETEVTKSCGEGCLCEEWGFPTHCYQYSPLGRRAAITAQRANGGKEQ